MQKLEPVSRRCFLKVTSTVVGSAMLCPRARCLAADIAAGKPIVIRGHHLFDMLDALGTGKSSHKTLGPVAKLIRANPRVPLKIVIGEDDICGPCEWWDHEQGRCKRGVDKYPQDNANSFTSDKNALRVLGLKPGEARNAAELYRLIQAKVDQKVFAEEVCVACRLVNKCKETYEAKIRDAVKALAEPHAS
jgi:hypothetical protein